MAWQSDWSQSQTAAVWFATVRRLGFDQGACHEIVSGRSLLDKAPDFVRASLHDVSKVGGSIGSPVSLHRHWKLSLRSGSSVRQA